MAEVAEVLAACPGWTEEVDDERTDERMVFWRFRCRCGELLPRGSADKAYRAHLAEQIEALIVVRVGEAKGAAEWAVEVTWSDWHKAGAKGPTSQYGPFADEGHRDRFLECQRRDRDVAGTRVLARSAAYTPWVGEDVSPTSSDERDVLLLREWERIHSHTPAATLCAAAADGGQ